MSKVLTEEQVMEWRTQTPYREGFNVWLLLHGQAGALIESHEELRAQLEARDRQIALLVESHSAATAELDRLRAWADNGADESKWPPGKTISEAVLDALEAKERELAALKASHAEALRTLATRVERRKACTPEPRP